jgi:hypothetical protein
LRGQPEHYTGHNPAGAIAIVGLLVLAATAIVTGWAYQELGSHWLEEVHEAAASVMLGLVGVHLTGVLLGSWLHRENLVGAMITGRKAGRPHDAIRSAWRSVAAAVLVAVIGFWALQWQSEPASGSATGPVPAKAGRQHHDDD